MKQSITQSQFVDAFRDYGREDQFSYSALCALYNWLEDYEEDSDTEIELDVIALCCDFAEYAESELETDYGYLFEDDEMPEDMEAWIEALNEHTIVIPIDGSNIIIQSF